MRLLKSADFRRVRRYGKRVLGRYTTFHILEEGSRSPRIGLTVPKRFGKACVRNQFKRRMREAFRLSQHWLPPVSIHVAPEEKMGVPTLQALVFDLLCCFSRRP